MQDIHFTLIQKYINHKIIYLNLIPKPQTFLNMFPKPKMNPYPYEFLHYYNMFPKPKMNPYPYLFLHHYNMQIFKKHPFN